ncbi:hypothetical protein EV562_112198 [Streptomyces sp. BK208]|nr:hypothetical protein EV562_112198 [Streptomyces sp. BK208]
MHGLWTNDPTRRSRRRRPWRTTASTARERGRPSGRDDRPVRRFPHPSLPDGRRRRNRPSHRSPWGAGAVWTGRPR